VIIRAVPVLILITLMSLIAAGPHDVHDPASSHQQLPKIAPAPDFMLTSQDGAQVTLTDFRGKVVAVTFIYTSCTSTCPVLTPMMSFVQDQLGRDFGRNIVFVSITVDPERDTPLVLKEYATSFGANLSGWSFLTGSPAAIRDVTRRYGVVASKNISGDVDHTFLTSIVDQHGILRLQYAGVRFDPEEFKRDLVGLLIER
jgi:protein SCO1